MISTWTVATNNYFTCHQHQSRRKVRHTSKLESTLNKLINQRQPQLTSTVLERKKCLEKRKSALFAFYCFWHSWNRTNAHVRFCPTQKCHIQFHRHSIGSLLTLRVERLLLFGSYFCGSGRSCGQNTELVDYILGWLELGGRWAAARPP